ncbi:ABC transporter permease [Caproiciproducens sp. LBM24188]|nr:ABC transporter permease [Clostridiales bacterium]
MKLVSSAEKAVIKKDFGEVWNTKMARTTLILVPAVLVVAIPALFLLMIYLVPTSQMNGVDKMMELLPPEIKYYTQRQAMYYFLTNYLCPMLFLMIPMMNSTVSAACSFVGEKERSTMETLLLTPLSVKQIFRAKVYGCLLISFLSSMISFVVFTIVVSAGDILLKMPFFFNWNWLVLVVLFAPALTIFGVIFMVLVSGRSKSYMESIQTSGYIVLPVVLLFIGQFTGLFQLDALLLFFISVGVLAADAVLLLIASHSFTPEKLLR